MDALLEERETCLINIGKTRCMYSPTQKSGDFSNPSNPEPSNLILLINMPISVKKSFIFIGLEHLGFMSRV